MKAPELRPIDGASWKSIEMATELEFGGQFVPGPTTAQGAAPRSGRRWPVILGLGGAGCLGLIILLVVLAFLLLHNALENCPPKDFPIYPGAQEIDFTYNLSGASSDCTVDWESDAETKDVTTFFDAKLASGAWQLVSKDEQSGEWSFQRRGDASTVGTIRFLMHGSQTGIEMEVLTGQSQEASPTVSIGALTQRLAFFATGGLD